MKLSLFDLDKIFRTEITTTSSKNKNQIQSEQKIIQILETALSLGLGHLKLLRKAKSLSAGEYQRLLLLKYLSYEGTGALFVFDEPSLGLADDQLKALLLGFKSLIQQGNTIIIVDHNKFFHAKADYLIKLGPGAGEKGGEVIFQGKRKDYKKEKAIQTLSPLTVQSRGVLSLKSPEIYGDKYSDISIKLNQINLVKGASGSGKTSLYIKILANELSKINHDKYLSPNRGVFKKINGDTIFENVIVVDSNLNKYTSRSTVGSITGMFPVVRKHFLKVPMIKSMGLKDGHLSYNSDLGQCPKCEGKGSLVVEMQFLEDIILTCEDCKGKKLKPRYSALSDGHMTVHEAFTSPVSEVLARVELTPKFKRVAEYLKILNLDYLSLDRQINSLSGGERQRIYLLSRILKNIQNSIIFFENISFGLSDVELNLKAKFLQDLNLKNNTLVIIDQHEKFNQIAHNISALGN